MCYMRPGKEIKDIHGMDCEFSFYYYHSSFWLYSLTLIFKRQNEVNCSPALHWCGFILFRLVKLLIYFTFD